MVFLIKSWNLKEVVAFKAIIILWSLATLVNKFIPRKISMYISILFEIQCFRSLARPFNSLWEKEKENWLGPLES